MIQKAVRSGRSWKYTINNLEMNEKQALDMLIAADYTLSKAREALAEAQGDSFTTVPNRAFDLSAPVLTSNDHQILNRLKYTYTDKGEVQWLVCKNKTTNTYIPAMSIEQGLRSVEKGEESLYEHLKETYFTPALKEIKADTMNMFTPLSSSIAWDEESQSVTRKKVLFFSDYLNEAIPYMEEETKTFLLKEVKPLSNDKSVPNYMYFDRNQVTEGDCSAWLEFEEHFDKFEKRYFRAWIWSIFEEKCTDTRVLYLYDNGGGGKSTMINALQDALGHAFGVIDATHMSSNFIGSEIVGKRLVVEPDNKSANVCMNGLIHKISTGDTIRIEHKGRDAFNVRVYSRVLIAGNIKPIIDADKQSDARRLALIELKPYPEHIQKKIYRTNSKGEFVLTENGQKIFIGNHNFAEAMKRQLMAYLFICQKEYEQLCPDHNSISLPVSMANKQTEATQDDNKRLLALMVNRFVEFGEDKFCSAEEFSLFVKTLSKDQGKTNITYFKNDLEKIIESKASNRNLEVKWGQSKKFRADNGERISRRCHVGFSVSIPEEFDSPKYIIAEEINKIKQQTAQEDEE